jgi:hypothetical protein
VAAISEWCCAFQVIMPNPQAEKHAWRERIAQTALPQPYGVTLLSANARQKPFLLS